MVSTHRKSSSEQLLPQSILFALVMSFFFKGGFKAIFNFLNLIWKIHDNIKRHLYCIFKDFSLQKKLLRELYMYVWGYKFFWEIKIYILCLIGKTLRVITELHDSYKLQVLSSGLASKPGLLQTYKSANL